MSGVAVEDLLELWSVELRAAKARLCRLFSYAETAQSAALFLDGLLGPKRRKTGWMHAEAAGDPRPWRQQAVLGRSLWDAEALRDVVRTYTLETLADPDATLVIDESGFLKQGQASCGVGRQYTGSAGKITNGQIGVFPVYASSKGHPSSTGSSLYPKTGPAIQSASARPTCRKASASPPSRPSRWPWSAGRCGDSLPLGGGG